MAALATHKAASLGQTQRARRVAFEFWSCYRTTSTAATGHASYGISGSQKWLRKCLFNPAIDYNIGQTPLNTLRKCNNFLATGFPRRPWGFYRHFLMYKKCRTRREACSESGELGHIVWQASAAEWWRKSVGREVFPFAQASNEDIWRNRSQLEFVPFVSWRRTARHDGAETCAFYNQFFLLSCKLPQLIRDTRGPPCGGSFGLFGWRGGEAKGFLLSSSTNCQTEIWQLGGS